MQSTISRVKRIATTAVLLILAPVLVVCSGDTSTATISPPGSVSDLSVSAIASTSVTLTFTQVDDGTGEAASYDVRYAVAPISWGAATATASGTCSTPVTGTGIGTQLTCSILGLEPSTTYNFQLIAFRGALNSDAVFGGQSNVASASTPAVPPPPPGQTVTTVTVAPSSASVGVGANTTLQATVKDQNGTVMSGQSVSWSTSDPSIATVNSSGVVAGVGAGSATITATCAGKSGTATITVTAAPPPPPVVTTVTVSPPSASILVGANTTLQATVKDANGNVMTGQTITWSTSSSSVATVSSSGVVTGVAAGSATITATCAGKSGTSTVTVTAPPPVVTTVTVAPSTPSIDVGATVALTATVKDAQGNVMTGQTVTWSSSNNSIAMVSSSGVVTGVAAGSATITATCSGKTGTSAVTVTSPPPPGGGTILFQEDFENGNLGSRGWYDNTTAQVSTTEHVTGSTASAQYHFLSGASTPTSGGSQRHKFTPSNSLYVSFYVKYSTNWIGSGQAYHPHEFYILSTMDGDYDGPSENFLDVYI